MNLVNNFPTIIGGGGGAFGTELGCFRTGGVDVGNGGGGGCFVSRSRVG